MAVARSGAGGELGAERCAGPGEQGAGQGGRAGAGTFVTIIIRTFDSITIL